MMFELTGEQRQLKARAREFAETVAGPKAAEVDRTEEYPWDTVEALTEAGFMGMTTPREYGGQGLTYFDAALVVEEMAKQCGVTARIVVEGNMGAIGAIMKYGTEWQKQKAAELVLAGDKPAICITEPTAGSAATDMKTTAVKQPDGSFVVNGVKHWITGGGVSRLHVIFARLVDNGEDVGIAGFMAFRDEDEGLEVGTRHYAMGLRGLPETEIRFRDMRLPPERIIIPPEGIRRGFAGLMNAYNSQRVGAATVALGIGQGAFDRAAAFVKKRRQFGRPIAEFQGLQWMIADMNIALEAARMLIWRAAKSAEHTEAGFPDPLLAAQAKVLASETAVKVTNDALQLHGAAGYGRALPMERLVRDARMFTIGGGTAQMLRNLVAGRVLGMKTPQRRCGWQKLAEREGRA